jgi:hypothetical protein
MTDISKLSIKQREQLASYKRWKISKSSLGKNPQLLRYFLGLVNDDKLKLSNA